MFDYVPAEFCDEPTKLARCLFFDHGHKLAEAAAMLGGASAEARVVSCASTALSISVCTRLSAPFIVVASVVCRSSSRRRTMPYFGEAINLLG